MAIYTIDKPTITGRLGGLCQQVDAVFLRVQQFKGWMDQFSDASLISAYGFVQADLDTMRSTLVDLEQLRTIYQGTATLAVAKDFRGSAKQVYPFGSI